MAVIVHSATIAPDGETITVDATVDGQDVKVIGWVSAMNRYYPDDTRDALGNRVSAISRPMTAAERFTYIKSLLTPHQVPIGTPLVLPGMVPRT